MFRSTCSPPEEIWLVGWGARVRPFQTVEIDRDNPYFSVLHPKKCRDYEWGNEFQYLAVQRVERGRRVALV